jgi:hypothetical protein
MASASWAACSTWSAAGCEHRGGAFAHVQVGHIFVKINNNDPKPFVWAKTAEDILVSIVRFRLELLTHDTR